MCYSIKNNYIYINNKQKERDSLLSNIVSKGILGHISTSKAVQCHTVQLHSVITQNIIAVTFVFYPCILLSCISVDRKKNETSMLIWENNPLTLKFLVTSFGIAVSLYTSFFLKLVCILLNVFLTLLLFFYFSHLCFFCLLCFLNIVHH